MRSKLTESQRRRRSRREHRFRTEPLLAKVVGDLSVGLILADIIAVLGAAFIIDPPLVVLTAIAGTLLVCRMVARVYRHRFGISWVNELPRTVGSVVAAALVCLTLIWAWGQDLAVEVVQLAATVGALALLLQLLAMMAARWARCRWDLGRRTVIVGDGPVATRLAALMRAQRAFGMRPVAVLESHRRVGNEPLARLVRRTHAEAVVLAFSVVREAEVLDEVIHASRSGVTLFVVPRLFEIHHDSADVERLLGYPMVRFRRDPTTQPSWLIKRCADAVAAALLLVLTSPLLGLGMLLVYLDGGRPVFFRQIRLGRDAKPITIHKLRSMSQVPQDQSDTAWSAEQRTTRVGRVLRRTSLDELPQLLNILRGEMSFVGPRPERPGFVRQFSQEHARYWARHRVPVGLTGLAQISGLRGDTSIQDRARFDNYYIANWSLWLDCKILLQTVKELVIPAKVVQERPWRAGQPTIVHVSQPTTAGVANVVLNLVRDQVARGWDVHVACPSGKGYLFTDAEAAGATVHAWEAGRAPGRGTLGEARRLHGLLCGINPDLVHLHSAKAGLAGRLAVRGARPTVFQPHAWSFEAVTGRLRLASTQWERIGARWSDVTICVSEAEYQLGRRMRSLSRRIVVVPNGVDLERFRDRDRGQARVALDVVEPRAPLVVCVGRVDEQKGQDLLLRAWPLVLAAHPRARLAIVGDGPKLAELQAGQPERVDFAGFSPRVEEWLAAADVVVIPSRWEGMPLLALEAMGCARPCVAFDVNGIQECLGDSGVIVPAQDVPGLADALIRYLADPEKAVADGLALRQRAERSYTLSRAGDGVAAVVRGLTHVEERRPVEIDLRAAELAGTRRERHR